MGGQSTIHIQIRSKDKQIKIINLKNQIYNKKKAKSTATPCGVALDFSLKKN